METNQKGTEANLKVSRSLNLCNEIMIVMIITKRIKQSFISALVI